MRDVVHLVSFEKWTLQRPLATTRVGSRDEAALARADEQVNGDAVMMPLAGALSHASASPWRQ
jgi:hypothetical protein